MTKYNDYQFIITPKLDGISCRVYMIRSIN